MRTGIGLVFLVVTAGVALGQPVAKQITAADTALLFGGADAEGGVGDWYLSNGVVHAIIDDVGVAQDLVGVVPPGQEPPIQSEVSPTGGTIIDLGAASQPGDEIPQLFTVGGLSTSNFILYAAVSAPSPGTIRATGKLLLPPISDRPSPCIDIATDYSAGGNDPFVTITTTATNGCGQTLASLGGFLDAVVWTQRGIVPFSAGAPPSGGRGFDHPVLDLTSPATALEFPTFVAAPGQLGEEDGVMDPATGALSHELAYGLVPVEVEVDGDGPGGNASTITAVDSFFGVSSPLVTALGNLPVPATLDPGGTITYVRRVYAREGRDGRAVSDVILPYLASRLGFTTGTISGDVQAADGPVTLASIVIVRLGTCTGAPATDCKLDADCGTSGPCGDPVPTTGFGPGGAVTHVRTGGQFAGVVLPFGRYELRVSSPERDDVIVAPVVVDGDESVTIPPLAALGAVSFDVREKARRRPRIPAKLVFKGVEGTPDPRFHRDLPVTLGGVDLQPETFGGTQHGPEGSARGQGNVVYTATGTGTIQVRPGTYDVYASRGPEYGVRRRRITVPSGGTASTSFRLKRVIRTRDAISADFHVHSGRSLDSAAPLEDRVISFAAEGVEVMVSTDHDKQLDYAPVISSLGLASRVRSIAGVEVTGSVPNPPFFPNSIGHINAWPLPLAPDDPRDGAIQDEYVAPNWVFKRLREQGGPDVVIQYNHPRAGVSGLTSIGIFNSIGCGRCANAIDTTCTGDTDCPAGAEQECTCVGYQPDRPITMAPNDILVDTGVLGPGSAANPLGIRNLDFDVIEIANGAKTGDFAAYRQVRDDWFSLLSQGFIKPGTGVSDSHRITVEHAGWARTYVLGAGDDPAGLDVATFDQSIKGGRMVASAGPWIEVTAIASSGRKAGPGEVLSTTPKARLKIDVRSPAWIPVEEVRVVSIEPGGVVVQTFDATTKPRVKPAPKDFQSSGGTSRFRATILYQRAIDTLVLVEAGAKLPADPSLGPTSPEIVNVIEPDVVPLAFTNPIRFDRDENGFTPPGLAAAIRTAPPAGRMTGVTRAARADATRRGEYFPLHAFRLTPADVERARTRAGR